MSILSTLRAESVVSAINDHRKETVLLAVSLPILYYGLQFSWWIYKMKPVWNQLENNFPGPKKHWLYGNLHQHPGPGAQGMAYMQENTQEHVTAFLLWYTPLKPALNIVHPTTVKVVLKSTEPKQRSNLGVYELLFPWIGDGLLLSSGEKWFRNRRLLTPAFHFDVLKPYMNVYNKASDLLAKNILETCDEGPIEIYGLVNLMTLDVILKCAFSYDEDIQGKGDDNPYVSAVTSVATLFVNRIFKLWSYNDFLYTTFGEGEKFWKTVNFLHQVSNDIIKKRKEQLRSNPEESSKRYKDFLDILLLARDEEGKGLTDTEIRDEVDTFLFEGHDTTASAISWILYSLAEHPDIQAKVQHEVDQLFADRDNDHMQWEDVNNIPYTMLCIKEGLRMHSPVPIISREVRNSLTINGVDLKPGALIDIHIHCIHHNQHVWGPDHREYKPERFLPENMEGIDSYAFVPFAAGPRNCIGQNFAMNEIKVTVCHILHRFNMSVVPDKKPIYQPELVMRAKGGMYLNFSPRKDITSY